MQGDGCGNAINCGNCPANQVCGGGVNPKNGVCSTSCTPKSCQQQGYDCGAATDGCGGIINCGTCNGNQTCGGGGPNKCGLLGGTCNNLCLQQEARPMMGQTTSVTGTVYAPNGIDPLPNTLVYVPNAPLSLFTDGVSTPHCACGDDVSGSPLVSAVTDYKGNFTSTTCRWARASRSSSRTADGAVCTLSLTSRHARTRRYHERPAAAPHAAGRGRVHSVRQHPAHGAS
jgi:hypothetical protein